MGTSFMARFPLVLLVGSPDMLELLLNDDEFTGVFPELEIAA
jgi:hypothetical protein